MQWWMCRTPLRWFELVVAAALLSLVAIIAYGSHVLHGGFLMDDWSNAAKTQYLASCCGPGSTGTGYADYLGVVANMKSDGPAGYHLGLTFIAPVMHFLFGVHTGAHLAAAVAFALAMSLALYAVLRMLGVARLHAVVIGALVLLFPWTDSVRLWSMASYNQLAVVLWLAGVMVALRSLDATRTTRRVGGHALALALFATGMLIYELVAGVVLITAVAYVRRAPWKTVLARWAADVVTVWLALDYAVDNALPRGILPLQAWSGHASFMAEQSIELFALVMVPFARPSEALVLVAVLSVIAAAVVVRRASPRGDRLRAELSWWLTFLGLSVVVVGAGYAPIVPAPYGAPLDAGIENRVNMVAAIGWVGLAYSSAMLAGLMLARRRSLPLSRAVILPLTLSLILGIGYIAELDRSKEAYAASTREQVDVLSTSGRLGPYPAGSTLYVFGQPAFTAPGVPVFAWVWDLNPAMKVWLNDPSIQAHPMLPETKIECGRDNMFPVNRFGFGPGQTGAYGGTYFVDVARGVAHKVTSRADCKRRRAQFRPGPLVRGHDCTALGGGPATRLVWHCRT